MKNTIIIALMLVSSVCFSQSIESLTQKKDSLKKLSVSIDRQIKLLTAQISEQKYLSYATGKGSLDIVRNFRPKMKAEAFLFSKPSPLSGRQGKVLVTDSIQMISFVDNWIEVIRLSDKKVGFINSLNVEKDDEYREIEKILTVLQSENANLERQKQSRIDDSLRKAARARSIAAYNALKPLERVNAQFDDVTGITWYKPKKEHKLSLNRVSVYAGKEGNSVWLRLKITYHSDDWIFFEKVLLSYSGITKSIPFERYEDKETDNSYSGVYEWIDIVVTPDILEYLRGFSKSDKAKHRLIGKYSRDWDVSDNERRNIREVIDAYDFLRK